MVADMALFPDSILVAGIVTLAVTLIAIVGLVSYWRAPKQVSSSDQADVHEAQEQAKAPEEPGTQPEVEADPPAPEEPGTQPEVEADPPAPEEPGTQPEVEADPPAPKEPGTQPEVEADPPAPEEPGTQPEVEADPPAPEEPGTQPEVEADPPAPEEPGTQPEVEADPPAPEEPGTQPEVEADPPAPEEPGTQPEVEADPPAPEEPGTQPEVEVDPPAPDKPETQPEVAAEPLRPYVPSIRTPKPPRTKPSKERAEREKKRTRSVNLRVSVRVVFGRRNSVQVSLLPVRGGGLGEVIEVMGPNGEESWFAFQDEWYGDLIPADISDWLASGMRWTCGSTTWTLSPRDIFVLASNQTIYGFVSTTRLLLNEDHLILCQEGAQEIVREELERAGCVEVDCRSGHGIPEGWVLFSNVRPTVAVDHDESAGIRNVLRPVEDIDIFLEGGIRLSHKRWLHDHPPRIRIRGGLEENPAVSIDAQAASRNGDGSYETQTSFKLGPHVVFCGGVNAQYEIAEGQESWDPFVAFRYNMDRDQNREVSVCGPTVMGDGKQTLVPATNKCLVGAKPGQIYNCNPPYDQSMNTMLAITKFPVVWALPANPYQCKKSKVFALAISAIEVSPLMGYLGRRLRPTDEVFRWCNAILNCSRKGLRTDPDEGPVMQLWIEYVRAARQIRRSLK